MGYSERGIAVARRSSVDFFVIVGDVVIYDQVNVEIVRDITAGQVGGSLRFSREGRSVFS